MSSIRKPAVIKWIQLLLLFRIAIIVAIYVVGGMALYGDNNEAIEGVGRSIFYGIQLDSPETNPAHSLGYLIGYYMLFLIAIGLELMFLQLKKRTGLLIVLSLDLFLSLGTRHLTLFVFIVLLLALSKSAKAYLNNEKVNKVNADVLDQDI